MFSQLKPAYYEYFSKTNLTCVVGCMAMIALCRENVEHQNRMCDEGGIDPLVRLVKSSKSSERVLVTGIKTLGILCIGMCFFFAYGLPAGPVARFLC